MIRILGIDLGASGALVLLSGRRLRIWDMPVVKVPRGKRNVNLVEAHLVSDIIRSCRHVDHAFIEKTTSKPGQGAMAMKTFGRAIGVIEGVLAMAGIPVTEVHPRVWQKAMGLQAGAGKDAARSKAMALWPRYSKKFKRVMDNGRADAALIAKYGRRSLKD